MIDHPWPQFDWDRHFRAPRRRSGRYIGAGDRKADVIWNGVTFAPSKGHLADRPLSADPTSLLVGSGYEREQLLAAHVRADHQLDTSGRVLAFEERLLLRRPSVYSDPDPHPDFIDFAQAATRALRQLVHRVWPIAIGLFIALILLALIGHLATRGAAA